jgi:hypothetical protein
MYLIAPHGTESRQRTDLMIKNRPVTDLPALGYFDTWEFCFSNIQKVNKAEILRQCQIPVKEE